MSAYLVEEIDVSGGQFERLYFGQFVRGQSWNDLAKGGERLVEALRALALADVGQDALRLQVERRRCGRRRRRRRAFRQAVVVGVAADAAATAAAAAAEGQRAGASPPHAAHLAAADAAAVGRVGIERVIRTALPAASGLVDVVLLLVLVLLVLVLLQLQVLEALTRRAMTCPPPSI